MAPRNGGKDAADDDDGDYRPPSKAPRAAGAKPARARSQSVQPAPAGGLSGLPAAGKGAAGAEVPAGMASAAAKRDAADKERRLSIKKKIAELRRVPVAPRSRADGACDSRSLRRITGLPHIACADALPVHQRLG